MAVATLKKKCGDEAQDETTQSDENQERDYVQIEIPTEAAESFQEWYEGWKSSIHGVAEVQTQEKSKDDQGSLDASNEVNQDNSAVVAVDSNNAVTPV